jgi:uncharacterized coiled-coil protein SlyX
MDDLESLYDQLDAYAGVIRNRDARIAELESQLAAKIELVTLLRASLAKVEGEMEGLRREEDVSLRAMYEDACIQANKSALDARRYRCLRDFGKDGVNINPPCEHVHACLYTHPVGLIPVTRAINGAELDAAIDAALANQKEG